MKITSEGLLVQFDLHLVEESVLQAAEVASPSERDTFRRERDAIYEVEITDVREASFRDLDARWFQRFGVADVLLELLREHSSLVNQVSGCFVLPAWSSKDEASDLHAAKGQTADASFLPALVIHLRPKTLISPEPLKFFLRHELVHIGDMLEPEFGYKQSLPELDGGPMLQRLIQDRYRVLWNTTVDGRLATRGGLPMQQAEHRREEFLATFRMLGAEAERHFERFFHESRPTHAELVAFAIRPTGSEGENGQQCPLCNLPTSNLHPHPSGLHPRIVVAIHKDFPEWKQEMGLCLQCTDLYDSRASG